MKTTAKNILVSVFTLVAIFAFCMCGGEAATEDVTAEDATVADEALTPAEEEAIADEAAIEALETIDENNAEVEAEKLEAEITADE